MLFRIVNKQNKMLTDNKNNQNFSQLTARRVFIKQIEVQMLSHNWEDKNLWHQNKHCTNRGK